MARVECSSLDFGVAELWSCDGEGKVLGLVVVALYLWFGRCLELGVRVNPPFFC